MIIEAKRVAESFIKGFRYAEREMERGRNVDPWTFKIKQNGDDSITHGMKEKLFQRGMAYAMFTSEEETA